VPTNDLVSAVAVDRERWRLAFLSEYRRSEIQAEVAELLRFKAQQAAATRGRIVSTLLQIEARPADEVDELELLDDDVRRNPAQWIVVRARWSTTDKAADSDGVRRIEIKVPAPRRGI
jgi:hypothetical protein